MWQGKWVRPFWLHVAAAQIVCCQQKLCRRHCNLFNSCRHFFRIFCVTLFLLLFVVSAIATEIGNSCPAAVVTGPHATLLWISFEFMLNCELKNACYPSGRAVAVAVIVIVCEGRTGAWIRAQFGPLFTGLALGIIISNDCTNYLRTISCN